MNSDFGPPQPREEETVTTYQQHMGPVFNNQGDIVGKTKTGSKAGSKELDLSNLDNIFSQLGTFLLTVSCFLYNLHRLQHLQHLLIKLFLF